MAGDAISAAGYHDATKHHFHRFARSRGYLDWATQPDPFRRFDGARLVGLPRPVAVPDALYGDLFAAGIPPAPFTLDTVGSLLRYSMGLSAWKQYGASRWALRVNPSSGNLHPTEAYVAWDGRLFHYAPREHALEERAVMPDVPRAGNTPDLTRPGLLLGLTSIHWREAWKYGERAFRYCQHDTGHAIAALRVAAALHGWTMTLIPGVSHAEMASVLGVDRDADFEDAEREEPECVAFVSAGPCAVPDVSALADAARAARWTGRASRLSGARTDWPIIEAVAHATRQIPDLKPQIPNPKPPSHPSHPSHPLRAADIILQRRSATGFDPRGVLRRDAFLAMLSRLQPGAPPWDAFGWAPQVHLALFVHRVQDMTPGVYVYARDAAARSELTAAMRPEFIWEPVDGDANLYLLAPIDVRATANRLSCNQDIAEDGFFSLGMLARFDATLTTHGDWAYRRLFWETGMIGQVLYLEAEAAGARATGIGCFFDDPVHDLLGLSGHAWQSLYHFSMGLPVDDGRLTTEPGYEWERR